MENIVNNLKANMAKIDSELENTIKMLLDKLNKIDSNILSVEERDVIKMAKNRQYKDNMECKMLVVESLNHILLMHKKKLYMWVASSDDGCYNEQSKVKFDNIKFAYNNMRDAALEKAKWNTEFDEDFEDNVPIGYEFSFSPTEIVHISYSGVYTYKIIEVDE